MNNKELNNMSDLQLDIEMNRCTLLAEYEKLIIQLKKHKSDEIELEKTEKELFKKLESDQDKNKRFISIEIYEVRIKRCMNMKDMRNILHKIEDIDSDIGFMPSVNVIGATHVIAGSINRLIPRYKIS